MDFPIVGGFDSTFDGDNDAFVAKIGSSGVLLWSSYLGGGASDGGLGISTDAAGNALIVGRTHSADFPTPEGFDTTYNGDGDAFVAKVSTTGQLEWASFLGGKRREGGDAAWDIATDVDGSVFVTGSTSTPDFPTPGGFDRELNIHDAFVVKLSASGQLLWGSYLGGSGGEGGKGIAVGPLGDVVVVGSTTSYDFPTPRGFDRTHGGGMYDGFVAKISLLPALNVRTLPIQGVSITGDKPGVTDYSTLCDQDETINLTAPLSATYAGRRYSLIGWTVDGVSQPIGKNSVQIIMQANHTAVAAYEMQTWALTVQSPPIAGVSIAGDRPGVTDYNATCDDQEIVYLSLASPPMLFSGGKIYTFISWLVDGILQPRSQTGVQITMDADHTAEALYNMFADVNGDCAVNVLDLIFVRNHLLLDPTMDENWKADVNQDGTIDILDLIRVRNELGARCGE